MFKPFRADDWYWIVGAETQVFSSKRQGKFAPTDAAYVAWKADGTQPSRIASDAELREVLAPYGIGLTPAETAKLALVAPYRQKAHLQAVQIRRLARLISTLVTQLSATALTAPQKTAAQAKLTDIMATNEQSDPDN